MRLDLYNNPNTKDILDAIGLEESEIPRLRGVGIVDGKILIHTRTGGGNRETYGNENEYLTGNPYYISDTDDDFDCTYANFWFVIPPEALDKLIPLEDKLREAVFGNTKDYIEAVVGDDEAAKKRILKRLEAVEP